MELSTPCRLASAVLLLCATAGCQRLSATNGSGYQFVRFSNPQAAMLASQDLTAGPAIATNNAQCRKDESCRK